MLVHTKYTRSLECFCLESKCFKSKFKYYFTSLLSLFYYLGRNYAQTVQPIKISMQNMQNITMVNCITSVNYIIEVKLLLPVHCKSRLCQIDLKLVDGLVVESVIYNFFAKRVIYTDLRYKFS